MPEPHYAKAFGKKKPLLMDPAETLKVYLNYRPDNDPALLEGETLTSIISVNPTSTSALLGLEVLSAPKAPAIVGDLVVVWVKIAVDKQNDVAWNENGTRVGVEVTVQTNTGEIFQDTGLIQVAQK